MLNEYDIRRKTIPTNSLYSDRFSNLDEEARYMLEMAYWNMASERACKAVERKEKVKTKVLSIFKKK